MSGLAGPLSRAWDSVFTSATPSNRLLRIALLSVLVVLIVKALYTLVFVYPFGVDLEIPLRAARRWADGGQPYLASSFTAPPGATQPFLYPPFVLPFLSLLLGLPRVPLGTVWFGILLAAAAWTCHRLAIPVRWWPLFLAWPPFAEGLVAGNVQVLLFAAFVALFWRRGGRTESFRPVSRDPDDPEMPMLQEGLLSIAIAAVKASQFQPWLYVLGHRWRSALLGGLTLAILIAITLPVTGIALWGAWADQMFRAATATAWENRGFALSRFTPPGVGVMVTLVTMIIVVRLPRRRLVGETVGVLSVLGALSLQVFGLLFLLPAMLVIRSELALIGALFIATYSYVGLWAGILVISVAFLSVRPPAVASELTVTSHAPDVGRAGA